MKRVKHLHPDAIEEVEHLVVGRAAKIKYEANVIGNSLNDNLPRDFDKKNNSYSFLAWLAPLGALFATLLHHYISESANPLQHYSQSIRL